MAESDNAREHDDYLAHIKGSTSLVISATPSTNTQPIVSIRALRSYVTPGRLRKLLLCVGGSTNYETVVRERYLVVFSILLSIEMGPFINTFIQYEQLVDERLPFLTRDVLPEAFSVIFAQFYEAQWKFCAKTLVPHGLNDTRLPDNMVMPFKKIEILNSGSDSTISKVELFDEYNHLVPDQIGHPRTNVFILKSCRSDNAKLHTNEVDAYRTLLSHPSGQDAMQNMACFYGSWIQGNTCYILREYVGGGTLTQFFERTQPPRTEDGVLEFWTNFIQLLKPISCLHHLPDAHNHHTYRVGLHNDIKPDNILVSEQNGDSAYDVSFKLIDLGLTGFVLAGDFDETQMRDVHGTKVYSAPEHFRGETNKYMQQSIKRADTGKDIWALACVISEAAVWSVFGPTELADYRERRVEATAAIPSLKNTGYSGCFHDTTRVLPVVEQMHTEVFRGRRGVIDPIVHSILASVKGMMVQDPAGRTDAGSVHGALTRALDVARSASHIVTTQSPTTTMRTRTSLPNGPLPGLPNGLGLPGHLLESTNDSQEHQPSPRPQRRVTISDSPHGLRSSSILENTPNGTRRRKPHLRLSSGTGSLREEETWTHSPQTMTPNSARWSQQIPMSGIRPVPQPSTPSIRSALPEASVAEVLEYIRRKKLHSGTTLAGEGWLGRLHGRDQIFLIDDSESMLPHWDEVLKVLEALAYLVKNMDPDGIDVQFMNSCQHNCRGKNRKDLIKKFRKVIPSGQCPIGVALHRVLPAYYPKQTSKRTSWLSKPVGDQPGVNIYILTDGVWSEGQECFSTVQSHIRQLANRLGEVGKLEHVGIQFIRFGDDEVGTKRLDTLDDDGAPLDRDIVDTEPSTGNVFKMLFGSTDRTWDNGRSG